MKKSKRIISMFLAVLMLFGCFGAITASAMTNEAAEAAAAEFNATVGDHSGVYANKSEKEWKKTMTNLNKALASVLASKDVLTTIYSDATVSKLFVEFGKAVDPNTLIVGNKIDKVITNLDRYGAYPEVSEYLKTVTTYDEIDPAKLVWGITPGNEEEFAKAFGYAFGVPVGAIFGLVTGIAMDLYNDAIVPIMESFHVGEFKDLTTFKDEGSVIVIGSNGKERKETFGPLMTEIVMKHICKVIDAFVANPVEYLCEILPDFTDSYAKAATAIKANKMLGFAAPGLADMVPASIGDILAMIPGMILPADAPYQIILPEIDENYLITMSTAKAVASGRAETPRGNKASFDIQLDGNKTMVFAAVAEYLQETLQTKSNQEAIGYIIADKVGGYGAEYDDLLNASKEGTSFDVANALLNFADAVAEDLAANANPIVAFFAKVANFFTNIFQKIFGIFQK